MRLSIRYQLLLPLLTLMVGVVGMSVWTAVASASRARQQIEKQILNVGATVRSATFPRNLPTLQLMNRVSGADLLLLDTHRQPRLIDGQPLTTLAQLPEQAALPEFSADWTSAPLEGRVEIAGVGYICLAAPVGDDVQANLIVYVFYPET